MGSRRRCWFLGVIQASPHRAAACHRQKNANVSGSKRTPRKIVAARLSRPGSRFEQAFRLNFEVSLQAQCWNPQVVSKQWFDCTRCELLPVDTKRPADRIDAGEKVLNSESFDVFPLTKTGRAASARPHSKSIDRSCVAVAGEPSLSTIPPAEGAVTDRSPTLPLDVLRCSAVRRRGICTSHASLLQANPKNGIGLAVISHRAASGQSWSAPNEERAQL